MPLGKNPRDLHLKVAGAELKSLNKIKFNDHATRMQRFTSEDQMILCVSPVLSLVLLNPSFNTDTIMSSVVRTCPLVFVQLRQCKTEYMHGK